MGTIFKKPGSLFQWILFVFTILSVLCLLISYAAYYISPSGKFSYLAFFGLAYPLILSVNLIFMLIWLFLWKRYFWISFFTIILGFSHINALIQIDFNPEKAAAGSIKVMTFNVHSLEGIQVDRKDKSIRSKITNFLKIEKPHILCLQEFYLKKADTSIFNKFNEAILSKYYFYKSYYEIGKNRGIDAIAIFSRYPFIGNGFLKFNKYGVFAIYSDIIIDDEKIRVYNVHLESIHFGDEDYAMEGKTIKAKDFITIH